MQKLSDLLPEHPWAIFVVVFILSDNISAIFTSTISAGEFWFEDHKVSLRMNKKWDRKAGTESISLKHCVVYAIKIWFKDLKTKMVSFASGHSVWQEMAFLNLDIAWYSLSANINNFADQYIAQFVSEPLFPENFFYFVNSRCSHIM